MRAQPEKEKMGVYLLLGIRLLYKEPSGGTRYVQSLLHGDSAYLRCLFVSTSSVVTSI